MMKALWVLPIGLLVAGCGMLIPSTQAPPSEISLTATSEARVAESWTGAVLLEDGRCCAGGVVGETIQIAAAFSGQSPFAPILEMRALSHGYCLPDADLARAAWEPFVPNKTYPVQVFVNWTGFYVSVQFRDAEGNISPVFCDDISIEGNPPTPNP
jgi:hypothetical protein